MFLSHSEHMAKNLPLCCDLLGALGCLAGTSPRTTVGVYASQREHRVLICSCALEGDDE
jgi:hypothetical protein